MSGKRKLPSQNRDAEGQGRMGRAVRAVRHAELVAVRGWIRRLEDRIVGNEEHLSTLERRLEQGPGGVRDSSVVSRAHLEANGR